MRWNHAGWGWLRASCVWVSAACLLLSACHGSDESTDGAPGTAGAGSGGGAGTTPISVTSLDGILAGEGRGYCARLFRCIEGGDDFSTTRILLETPAACEALLVDLNAKSFSIRDLRQQLSQGALHIVPAKAEACLAEIAACNGTDAFTRGSCRDMFEGQVATGSPCQRSEDCAGDAFCEITSSCPGTCRARKAAGESCQDDDQCAAGDGHTLCDGNLASGPACRSLPIAPKSALGQPCTRHVAGAESWTVCKDSLWCAPAAGQPTSATLGTCQAPIPVGGPCSDDDDVCTDGFCDTGAGLCRTVALLKHAGEACDKQNFRICDPLLGLHCGAQGSCEGSGDGTQGAVCFSGDLQRGCNSGLYCQSDVEPRTCQPLLKAGASCEQGSSCESGNCQTTCQERLCAY